MIDEGAAERLLPLLSSMGIHSLDSLLGASNEQIAALKLKPIIAKKLQKLLEVKRGDNSTPATSVETHKTSRVSGTNIIVCNSSVAKQVSQNMMAVEMEGRINKSSDDNEAVIVSKFQPDESILIGAEQTASIEELVGQMNDCADKMRMLIEVLSSDQPNQIESRIDKARSYISSRSIRLSRLIKKKCPVVTAPAAQPVEGIDCSSRSSKSESITISDQNQQGTNRSILKKHFKLVCLLLNHETGVKAQKKVRFAKKITIITFVRDHTEGSTESDKKNSNDTNFMTAMVVKAGNDDKLPPIMKSVEGWKCNLCQNRQNDLANSTCSKCSKAKYVATNGGLSTSYLPTIPQLNNSVSVINSRRIRAVVMAKSRNEPL